MFKKSLFQRQINTFELGLLELLIGKFGSFSCGIYFAVAKSIIIENMFMKKNRFF